jgi:hypothetical protein
MKMSNNQVTTYYYTKCGWLFGAGGLALLYLLGGQSTQHVAAGAPQTCVTDWRRCKDNADLVNNYGDMSTIEFECMEKANSMAKYGDPEWPWSTFGTFLKGDDYPKTGIVTVKEKDVRFTNMFNAKVRTTVRCTFDLNAMKVVSVKVDN